MFEEHKSEPLPPRWRGLTLFGGVILPAIAISLEATTHMCAETFFDPVPTLWHVLLVSFVPVAHLLTWRAVGSGRVEGIAWLGLANAVAIGIAIFYTVVYAPLLPIAVIALVFFGLGVLPMTPVFALVAGVILRRQLRRLAPDSAPLRMRTFGLGLALAAVALVLLELPATITRAGMQMAVSESPEQRARGLSWLRKFGSEDYLLRACYLRSGRATDLIGFLLSLNDPVTAEQAREIYYRVHGVSFDSVPPPVLSGLRGPDDEFDFDNEQGGTTVSGKLKKLSLSSSRMDGSVDADAGLGYVEWTLVFKNDAAVQREARAQVQLPPGGVVSRLTLWVNGEEREAAFAGREQTRAAYQNVVRTRRDPVLVTTSGRDRVLVQCFPVPPSGEMKIRFGVTMPLHIETREGAAVRLPYFLERNFNVPEGTYHHVWIEAKKPLASASDSLRAEQPQVALFALRGAIEDVKLSEPAAVIRAARAGAVTEAWTNESIMHFVGGQNAGAAKKIKKEADRASAGEVQKNTDAEQSGEASARQVRRQLAPSSVSVKDDELIVRQSLRERDVAAVSRLVVVLDTSRQMRESLPEIAAALRSLPPTIELQIVLAEEGALNGGAGRQDLQGQPEAVADALNRISFVGGADNLPALARAWDLAAANSQSALVWIHGAQPVLIEPVEALRQRWERRPGGVPLRSIQAAGGANRIIEKLDGEEALQIVPRLNKLQIDLEKLFAELTGRSESFTFVRTREPRAKFNAGGGAKETSAHLARLWAGDEVARLLSSREQTEEAMRLAVAYQLVTPVSGAVVLETAEQYRQAGLEPVAAGTVPTIPEPETILLIAVVGLLLLWAILKRRGILRRQSV